LIHAALKEGEQNCVRRKSVYL